MKAVRGYTKDDYRKSSPSTKDFQSIEAAAEYLKKKWPERSADFYIESIMNDTNCDAVYFEDGSVILLGF